MFVTLWWQFDLALVSINEIISLCQSAANTLYHNMLKIVTGLNKTGSNKSDDHMHNFANDVNIVW